MAHRITLKEPGGTVHFAWTYAPTVKPGAGEVLVRQHAIGVNYIDIYHRTGLYPLPAYPAVLGIEAAGIVEEVGLGVPFAPGDRVAYCRGEPGAYAEMRVVKADNLVKLPDLVSFEQAAAGMVKGLTAHYLLKSTFPISKGDTILIHAAAGGVGLVVCQWAKYIGATVIGTVGTQAKAALVRANGCDHPIVYTEENVVQRVRAITGGRGVDVVYDSVGRDTFMDSLDCLRPLGMMVSFGQSSGKIPLLDIGILSQKGSLYLSRPTLMTHIASVEKYREMAADLFGVLARGVLALRVHDRLPLQDAAEAHRMLESRSTSGALVLTA